MYTYIQNKIEYTYITTMLRHCHPLTNHQHKRAQGRIWPLLGPRLPKTSGLIEGCYTSRQMCDIYFS